MRRRISPERRAAVAARRRAARERLRELRARRRKKPGNRWKIAAAVVAILLLLLLLRDCGPGDAVEPEGPALPVEVVAEAPAVEEEEPAPPPRLTGRVERRDRPEYAPPEPEPMPWLAAFRMQVAARSPRLAECFVGTGAPGRLRWSTSVQVADGAVSDHELEPVLLSQELSREERRCVLGVLDAPRYSLPAGGPVTPARVSLVIEF